MEIVKSVSEYGISVFCNVNSKSIGVCECSFIDSHLPNGVDGNYLYFNRIYVKPEYRNKGVGSKLLNVMLELVKDLNKPICCDINPYGDMSFEDLKLWYMKNGFNELLVEFKGYKYKQYWFNLCE